VLEKGYADGLVGRLPYEAGEICIDTMLDLTERGNPPKEPGNDNIFGTNLSYMIRVPLVLPTLTVDKNYLGGLRYFGYGLFGLIAVLSLVMIVWVIKRLETRIVRSSQPFFLSMVALGVLVMCSSIVPMSMDDENFSVDTVSTACNVTPWLVSMGFILVFSALYSNLRRVNRLVQSAQRLSKEKVTTKDVMMPFLTLTTANLTILISWSTIAPLEFERMDHPGTDPWNRVISTYGSCVSSSGDVSSVSFISTISTLNFGALLVANIQAYQGRQIRSEYSESK
jgi:gamma-aminobutyric acid type B receptor